MIRQVKNMVNPNRNSQNGSKDSTKPDSTEPKAYHLDPTGAEISAERLRYHGVNKIVLIVEDEKDKRENLENLANAAFHDLPTVSVSASASTNQALEELTKYRQESPSALLYAVLDYNMNRNEAGERRQTEGLFFGDDFQHFLQNGGIILYYSGYINEIRKSPDLMFTQDKFPNVVLGLAEKSGRIQPTHLVKVMGLSPTEIPNLREWAKTHNYDLLEILRERQKHQAK